MNEIRLDFLQNPPLDREVAGILLPLYNFNSIAIKEQECEYFRNKIAKRFDKQYALPFSFCSAGFLELFMNFKAIYWTQGLHYEIRHAIELVSKFIPTHNLSLNHLSEDLQNIDDSLDSQVLCILPLVNEDIFSLNPQINTRATLALDISYAQRLGLAIYNADIFLLNGATFGLPNGYGMIVSNKAYTSTLYKKGVSEAFDKVLDKQILGDSSNLQLFVELQKLLGKEVELFAKDFAPNTLPLRLKHINTRNLIEHLYLENIYLQGSQECYLGFIKPSNTLIALGYGQLVSRELCGVTFERLDDIAFVASKIAEGYKMIRLMEF